MTELQNIDVTLRFIESGVFLIAGAMYHSSQNYKMAKFINFCAFVICISTLLYVVL